ncbi:MAG: nicotinate phosphoribosyltransferase [Nitrospirae bacterium]|nr:MAG: nicotinate phosphoribosyltransferase [Nitrospirota bacterium]
MIGRDALLTDLYQLTMLQAYLEAGMEETAVFELFVRRLPEGWPFLVAAGLEQALDFLENFRFHEADLDWLAASGRFSPEVVAYLGRLRFTGDVDAVAEGTPVFADEPLLRVVAPLPVAQLVESRLLNLIHYPTLIATKAARLRLAAPGKLLVDFGMRRAHGGEAGLLAARAAYLAGFEGSATVAAGARFGVPVFGTMAHSFVQAHGDEAAAFESFARAQPDNVVLLIDTYDTEQGARRVVEVAPRLAAAGIRIKAVRIDSGDLADHARRVRAILDAAGLTEVGIFASSSLDEEQLRRYVAEGVPIDGYGVGTRLTTSADHPYLDCAYKLQEYAGEARRKRSEGKATWPGRKQVWRRLEGGVMAGDLLGLVTEDHPGEPLLKPVMRGGQRLAPSPPLEAVRAACAERLATLPEPYRRLEPGPPYPVAVSEGLERLAAEVDRRTGAAEVAP